MSRRFLIMGPGLLLAASLAMGAPAERWIHVHVEEGGDDGELVRINVPLSLVANILPHIEVDPLKNGRIDLDEIVNDELDGEIDIRAILEEIRKVEDADFVTVEGPDENVRVSKSNGFLWVHVEDPDGEETVTVKLPLTVVDAMLIPGSNGLDLAAGIAALGDSADGDLVVVEGRNERVRIWIDARNRPD